MIPKKTVVFYNLILSWKRKSLLSQLLFVFPWMPKTLFGWSSLSLTLNWFKGAIFLVISLFLVHSPLFQYTYMVDKIFETGNKMHGRMSLKLSFFNPRIFCLVLHFYSLLSLISSLHKIITNHNLVCISDNPVKQEGKT